MSSARSRVIEHLFRGKRDDSSKRLSNPVVTLEEVRDAIRAVNSSVPKSARLSDKNPANFFKDLIRRRSSANASWPAAVFDAGYTARQKTGGGSCFEFIPLHPGQKEPFPSAVPAVDDSVPVHEVESASLPLASRRLGRTDEPWLIQVAIRLRLIETHLAVESKRDIIHIDHLQMNVKLRKTEIDALFLAVERIGEKDLREVIVTCEAKTRSDDILTEQIRSQVVAVLEQADMPEVVIPIAIKTVGPSQIYLVEFEPVTRATLPDFDLPMVASRALYKLLPPVPGIGT